MLPRTIAHLQHDRMTARPDTPSMYYYEDESWYPITNQEVLEAQTEIGAGLWSLGVRLSNRVAVMSSSRYEWDMIDGGALGVGACVVSIYPTSTSDATDYILNHSGSKIVFLENAQHWEMVAPLLANQPNLDHVVMIDSSDMPAGDWIDLDKLRQIGREQLTEQPNLPEEARDAVKPDDLASLMYTSGTTGRPKGVALTHDMLYSNVEVLNEIAGNERGDTSVIYLPMSHILQRVNVYLGRYANAAGYFAPDITEFVMTCQEANPRFMSGVPRVFEKVHARIMAGVEQAPENRQKTFHNAIETGKAYSRLAEACDRIPLMMRLRNALYERLVFKPLRTRLFGTNIEYLTVGAAPISKDLLEFYYAIGLPVLEGYGLTETCSPITINRPEARKIGTVGPPLPGSEVKIAEDGEILLKGPSVFQMYFENEEATSDSFTEDGYFKSGDIGEIDE
ncbi:MAG: AMP-binding protein, partial [Chloroflexota bacterium]